MTRRALPLLALPLLLAACGGSGSGAADEQAASPAPPATSAPSSAPAPTSSAPAPDPELSVPAEGGRGPTSLTGTVEAGVEGGCLVLDSGGTTWLLLGPAATPDLAGREVTLTGSPAPEDTLTTCQQGTPFTVSGVG